MKIRKTTNQFEPLTFPWDGTFEEFASFYLSDASRLYGKFPFRVEVSPDMVQRIGPSGAIFTYEPVNK